EPAPVEKRKAPAARPEMAPLRILFVASAAAPFSTTGGRADVASGLSKALGSLGHDVTLVVPRYHGTSVGSDAGLRLAVEMGGRRYETAFYEEPLGPGARAVLVDHPPLFDREHPYGIGSQDYPDNPRRFGLLAQAALQYAIARDLTPDVIHANDWQTGLLPVYLRTQYADHPMLGRAATVFTVHNVAYQGLCASTWLPELGLGWELFHVDALEYWLHVSFLKGGITFADVVTTVSEGYANELLTPEFAFGFEGVFGKRREHFFGVLNGIDQDVWDPARDPFLPKPYTADDLAGKAEAKRKLLESYGLPVNHTTLERPLVAMISRMVDQKGLDLIAEVANDLAGLDASFVILGTGEARYERLWSDLARRHPERIGVRIGFDEPLAHLIEAGADLFMMPSRFEPCGLNQMYSLRYGTLPVVRATGGLADTVVSYQPDRDEGHGFTFREASGRALLDALQRAIRVYQDASEAWTRMQRRGMLRDFSWQASARAYTALYRLAQRDRLEARGQRLEPLGPRAGAGGSR
ncbi:MAG: glycogen synthase GlgA, partial [Vicinamibacteraceae bacterium]